MSESQSALLPTQNERARRTRTFEEAVSPTFRTMHMLALALSHTKHSTTKGHFSDKPQQQISFIDVPYAVRSLDCMPTTTQAVSQRTERLLAADCAPQCPRRLPTQHCGCVDDLKKCKDMLRTALANYSPRHLRTQQSWSKSDCSHSGLSPRQSRDKPQNQVIVISDKANIQGIAKKPIRTAWPWFHKQQSSGAAFARSHRTQDGTRR